MNSIRAPLEAGLHSVGTPERCMRPAAGLLPALSIGCALVATATLPHRLTLTEAISVSLTGVKGVAALSLIALHF